MTRYLWPWQRRALGILGGAAFIVLPWLVAISSVHEARAARERVCAAELRALKASAFLRDVVAPADPCEAVKIAAREMR